MGTLVSHWEGPLGARLSSFIMHSCQTMKALNKKKAKKESRKFYLTRIMVTVLSEDAPISARDMELNDIHDAITDGDCVGEVEVTSAYRISRKEIVHALNSMNSQPGFFGLDDKGKDVRE